MKEPEQTIRYGRCCPICGKPVELRLITYDAPFRCPNCEAMLDISSFYVWLSHALASTLALVFLWKAVHFNFWSAAVGTLILILPLRPLLRSLTKPIIPLEPSD